MPHIVTTVLPNTSHHSMPISESAKLNRLLLDSSPDRETKWRFWPERVGWWADHRMLINGAHRI
jgi:hypothetical protein